MASDYSNSRGLKFLVGLLLSLLNGCQSAPPPGVEILVPPKRGAFITAAELSPKGDKLRYHFSNGKTFVLDLVTGSTHELETQCGYAAWLDNQTLFCRDGERAILVDVGNFKTNPLTQVDAQKQNVSNLLAGAQKVYELKGYPNKRVYLILKAEKNVYLFNVKDSSQLSSSPLLTVIPNFLDRQFTINYYSQNNEYYFSKSYENSIKISNKSNKKLFKRLFFENHYFHIAGWMYDSSGVIYYYNTGNKGWRSYGIYKLTVPE